MASCAQSDIRGPKVVAMAARCSRLFKAAKDFAYNDFITPPQLLLRRTGTTKMRSLNAKLKTAALVAIWTLVKAVDPARTHATIELARHEAPIERTYLFSNVNWWESSDHQMTTAITLLALAFNISAISVVPDMTGVQGGPRKSYSLLSDFYDIEQLRKKQETLSVREFLGTDDYRLLQEVARNQKLTFPKASQERYEDKLKVLSSIGEGSVGFGMPHVDPENMDMPCSRIPGTIHLSRDGRVRYVFLDRVHFYHFCTERFMPWWYDVRMHLVPREEYGHLAQKFADSLPKPLTVVHIRDLMDLQREREDDEIQGYAGQIVDAMRRSGKQRGGSLYLSYAMNGRSVLKVAKLLEDEFAVVKKCMDLYVCGHVVGADAFTPALDPALHQVLFGTHMGANQVEVALSMEADHFVGNVFSPYSRNVALYRKYNGKTYDMLKGFGEMKKVYRWHL